MSDSDIFEFKGLGCIIIAALLQGDGLNIPSLMFTGCAAFAFYASYRCRKLGD